MATGRKHIPEAIRLQVLLASRRTCCVCMDGFRPVQLHHIDANPNNNDPHNLAVLCQFHHAEAHTEGGLSARLSPKEIARCKIRWEQSTDGILGQQPKVTRPATFTPLELFVAETLAMEDGTAASKSRLDALRTLFSMYGMRSEGLKVVGDMAAMSALMGLPEATQFALDTLAGALSDDAHRCVDEDTDDGTWKFVMSKVGVVVNYSTWQASMIDTLRRAGLTIIHALRLAVSCGLPTRIYGPLKQLSDLLSATLRIDGPERLSFWQCAAELIADTELLVADYDGLDLGSPGRTEALDEVREGLRLLLQSSEYQTLVSNLDKIAN